MSAAGQDWTPVVFHKKKEKVKNTEKEVNKVMQNGGQVQTIRKQTGNKQHAAPTNARKLDEETETFRHDTVGLEMGKRVQQARALKKWTQKDLAQRINEKPAVVNEYELGKAIPNQQIISK